MVLFFTSFLVSSQTSFSVVGLPHYTKEVGLTKAQLSLLLSIFPLCAGIMAFFAGPVSDIFGRRRTLIVGLLALGVSLAAHGFAQEFFILVAFRALAGSAIGALAGLPSTCLSDHVPTQQQRPLIAKCISGYALGHTIGIPAGIKLIDTIGFLELNVLSGFLSLITVPLAFQLPPAPSSTSTPSGRRLIDYLRDARSTLASPSQQTLIWVSTTSFAAISLFHVSLALWLYEEASLLPGQLAPMYLFAGIVQVSVLIFLLRSIEGVSAPVLAGWSLLVNALLLAVTAFALGPKWLVFGLYAGVMATIAARIPSLHFLINHAGKPSQKGLRMSLVQGSNHLGKTIGAAAGSFFFTYLSAPQLMITASLLLVPCSLVLLAPATRSGLGRVSWNPTKDVA